MELAMQAAALCVAGALLALTVRQGSTVMALLLAMGIAVAVLVSLMEPLETLFTLFRSLGEESGLSQGTLLPLYKTLGIALVVRLSSNLCRDAGESALASAVETAGTVCALLCTFPLLREVAELLIGLMR